MRSCSRRATFGTRRNIFRALVACTSLALGLAGCTPAQGNSGSDVRNAMNGKTSSESVATANSSGRNAPKETRNKNGISVVATTPVIGDIASNIGRGRATVTTLIPPGSDPHSYEPTLHNIRDIARARLVLSNGLLLEEQRMARAVTANLAPDATHKAVAEEAPKYGARIIPLVEDLSLSTIWLGMRVQGKDSARSTITIEATDFTGPGNISAFLTGTFGAPTPYINTADGLNKHDKIDLPADAHTHMSWAFSKPGMYTLTLRARVNTPGASRDLGSATYTFAVGTTPKKVFTHVLDHGHMDIATSFNKGLGFWGDDQSGQSKTARWYPAEDSVVVVPDVALAPIPTDPAYRFLGRPGHNTYLLAQAVLGKHVHGEIDPHMWLDPQAGEAYIGVIRDALIGTDPQGRGTYEANARKYVEKLRRVRDYSAQVLARVPEKNRNLITTHDGFGYLAHAFGLKVAGFVTRNPAIQPSARDAIALNRTIATLGVPAVFVEPTATAHVGELVQVARTHGVSVCSIYSESFTKEVPDYLALLATNARNISTCLNPEALAPPDFHDKAS